MVSKRRKKQTNQKTSTTHTEAVSASSSKSPYYTSKSFHKAFQYYEVMDISVY